MVMMPWKNPLTSTGRKDNSAFKDTHAGVCLPGDGIDADGKGGLDKAET